VNKILTHVGETYDLHDRHKRRIDVMSLQSSTFELFRFAVPTLAARLLCVVLKSRHGARPMR
jgi:hypothetical protein